MKELRNYQSEVVNKVQEIFKNTNKIPVLGMATGTGKTFTAYHIIKKHLSENPNSRVLVLTHNQKILRRNFQEEELLSTFEITTGKHIEKSKKYPVVVAIPATLNNKNNDLGNFTLIVVDEAHEFYSKKMVQRLLNKFKNAKQLLLTASHWKFSSEKFHKLTYSIIEGLKYGCLADAHIDLLNSSWNFSQTDFNQYDELRMDFLYKKQDVENICERIDNRLRALTRTNVKLYNIVNKLPSYYSKLPKTLFACHNIALAKEIFKYFDKKYPNEVCISVSGQDFLSDKDSTYIDDFKKDDTKRLLVVVKRGVLGFDCPDLEALVDLTGSGNVDRTMQLMGRLLRKSNKNIKKSYFKIMPEQMEYYTRGLMSTVIALGHPENYSIWNDKVCTGVKIITNKKRTKRVKNSLSHQKKANKAITIPEYIMDFSDYEAVFDKIKHKHGDILSTHSTTTWQDVRAMGLISKPKGYWNYDRIFEIAKKYKSLVEWRNEDPKSYDAAHRLGLYRKIIKELNIPRLREIWNYNKCLYYAKKCNNYTEWVKKYPKSHYGADRLGIINKIINDMGWKKREEWTPYKIEKDAIKKECIEKWRNSPSYQAAYKRKIHKKIIEKLGWKTQESWNYEKLKNNAKQYSSYGEWIKKDRKAYWAALKLKFHRKIAKELGWKIKNTNTSGYVGIIWNKSKKRWLAQIKINKTQIHLGTFKNKGDAIKARKEAEKKYLTNND